MLRKEISNLSKIVTEKYRSRKKFADIDFKKR